MVQASDAVRPGGDPAEAVRALIDREGGAVFAFSLRLCGNRADAEDLTQETFLQAFRRWETFQGRSSARSWLFTIATRLCRRMRRKRSGEPDRIGSLEDLLPFGEPRIAALYEEQEDALQEQVRREAIEGVEEAIAGLPDEFRIPLVLKDIAGFSAPEVAAALDMEEGTVKSRVHRARLRVRQAVDRALPRSEGEAPPPSYSKQVCLDLLRSKQEALDRGAPFRDEVICDRCRSVFASMDLAADVCRELGRGVLPADLRERVLAAATGDGEASGDGGSARASEGPGAS
jgi:RNA polymerase sigma-70 factor (ECF subfamily)